MPLLASLVFAAALASASEPKQIYQMSPQEAGAFITELRRTEPDLRKRIAAIGRRNIGQPYKLNLLGEFPYELHDTLPMYSLGASDCLVFAEHTYAMALSASWEEFFWTLQRIRYKDGVIGVASRNHYMEVDWNINNRWLLSDASSGASYAMRVDRARFLLSQHHVQRAIPVQDSVESFLPVARAMREFSTLEEGDLVEVVSVRQGQHMVTHVGLVVLDAQGQRRLLHSSAPAVREEPFEAFIARTQARPQNGLAGFKFLRLNESIAVPPAAPQPRPAA
ncbi:N-acetylmuramoyl-L-alanine amidase-like domain-containing protein [Pseudoduganella violaceinigra]|uniref:N-acetylmuramoyl-L-alanine amidase-like domain-containing protein n=1 Tax=Pseudoduganella violaceinigra TaxID=246602 RepID=UPI0003FA9587|nr:N-acetylmuramoyl-L-alanine amidase-like domain-containing protein [Pseudoduganella violaceinigra]